MKELLLIPAKIGKGQSSHLQCGLASDDTDSRGALSGDIKELFLKQGSLLESQTLSTYPGKFL